MFARVGILGMRTGQTIGVFFMQEIWKNIEGYNGDYKISNLGNIMSTKRIVKRNNGRDLPMPERIMKPFLSKRGYLLVTLNNNKKTKHHSVHRLVAIAFISKVEDENIVHHVDGNPLNNNLNNLEWCTISKNTKHAVNDGFLNTRKGRDCNFAKLTEKEVIKIKRMLKGKVTHKKISIIYGVCPSTITEINRGANWAQIQTPEE